MSVAKRNAVRRVAQSRMAKTVSIEQGDFDWLMDTVESLRIKLDPDGKKKIRKLLMKYRNKVIED